MNRTSVMVTGIAGFIGSRLADRLLLHGYHVIGVDDLSSGVIDNVPGGAEFIECDLATANVVEKLPRHCRLIFHLAGQSSGEVSFDNPVEDLFRNTATTLNMIRYGIENKSTRILYASSMSVYGDHGSHPVAETSNCKPLSCYGVSKLASEGYLSVYSRDLPFISLRMFNVYGPGQNLANLRQGMVSIYLAQALKGASVCVKGSANRFRDFIFIDDVIDIWIKAIDATYIDGILVNVGTGVKTTVGELLVKMARLIPGLQYSITDGTPGDQSGIYADTETLHELIGIGRLTSLEDGLRQFVESVPALLEGGGEDGGT
jgi:UDP-glucose 4-epimerase